MVTSQMLKSEIDLLSPEYYVVVHNVLRSLEMNKNITPPKHNEWSAFVEENFGGTSDSPLIELEQLSFDSRDELI